jgi:hypothetical protein
MLNTQRSPLVPFLRRGNRLEVLRGGNRLEVPVKKGDLGGSFALLLTVGLLKHPLSPL